MFLQFPFIFRQPSVESLGYRQGLRGQVLLNLREDGEGSAWCLEERGRCRLSVHLTASLGVGPGEIVQELCLEQYVPVRMPAIPTRHR